MKDVDKKILARIQKMLALSKDAGATPEEAATAAAMAANLMRKYGIEHAEEIKLALQDDEELSAEFIEEQYDHTGARYPKWLNILVTAAAKHFDCHARLEANWLRSMMPDRLRNPYVSMKLYGYKHDVAVARWTITYLVNAVQKSVDAWWETQRSSSNQHLARQLKQDYRLGMTLQLVDRLKQLVEVQESASRGLVVVKNAAVERKYGDFKYNTSRTEMGDMDAYLAGVEAGKRVPINKPIEGGQDRGTTQRLAAG